MIGELRSLPGGGLVVSIAGAYSPSRLAPALVRLDSATGREVWRWAPPFAGGVDAGSTRLQYADARSIAVKSIHRIGDETMKRELHCLDAETGVARWVWPISVRGGRYADHIHIEALPDGDLVILAGRFSVSGAVAPTLTRRSMKTGEIVWESPLHPDGVSPISPPRFTISKRGEIITMANYSGPAQAIRGEWVRWSPEGLALWRSGLSVVLGDFPFGLEWIKVSRDGNVQTFAAATRMERRLDFRALLAHPTNPKVAWVDEERARATLRSLRLSDGKELPARQLGDVTEVYGEFIQEHHPEDDSLVLSSSGSTPGGEQTLVFLRWPVRELTPGGHASPMRREYLMPFKQYGAVRLISPDGKIVIVAGETEDEGAQWWVARW